MGITIGKRIRRNRPPGDYVAMCDYCGANHYRSELRRDGSGLLACRDEGPGLDRVTLDEINASYRPRGAAPAGDGGHYVTSSGTTVQFTDPELIDDIDGASQ